MSENVKIVTLGKIHSAKGEIERAISHFEAALRIVSSSNWYHDQFWIHFSLALLFFRQGRFDDSHACVEDAKSQAFNSPYLVARAMQLKAAIWCEQHRLREARSEALRAADALEKLGAMTQLEDCRGLLHHIEKVMEKLATRTPGTE